MPRLIDADELIKNLDDRYCRLGGTTNHIDHLIRDVLLSVIEDVDDMPTIEAEPVRHGKWVQNDLGETFCSECNNRIPHVKCFDLYPDCCEDDEDMMWDEETKRTEFCPHCGAKMDLE